MTTVPELSPLATTLPDFRLVPPDLELGPVSPELALVDPELAQRARAALADVAPPPVALRPAPTSRQAPAHTAEHPRTEAPALDAPALDAPALDAPALDAPALDAPASQAAPLAPVPVAPAPRARRRELALALALGALGAAAIFGLVSGADESSVTSSSVAPSAQVLFGASGEGEQELTPGLLAGLEDAARRTPSSALAREELGVAYLRLRRWEDAERELRALVQLAPNDDYAHFALATALTRQGKGSEAARELALAESLATR